MLSVHGVSGYPKSRDGRSKEDRYDSEGWMEYEFKLKGFNYDQSIEIIVSKQK